jgi:hypothetical protein
MISLEEDGLWPDGNVADIWHFSQFNIYVSICGLWFCFNFHCLKNLDGSFPNSCVGPFCITHTASLPELLSEGLRATGRRIRSCHIRKYLNTRKQKPNVREVSLDF